MDPTYFSKIISKNAGITENSLNELIADGIILINRVELQDSVLERLIKEVLHYDG